MWVALWFNLLVPETPPPRERLQLPRGGVPCKLQTATNWTLISLKIPWNFSVMLGINICKHHFVNRISGLATQQCISSSIQLWAISGTLSWITGSSPSGEKVIKLPSQETITAYANKPFSAGILEPPPLHIFYSSYNWPDDKPCLLSIKPIYPDFGMFIGPIKLRL